MLSLHLTGSPWFLLLIPPGLWILRRQYLGFSGDGSGASGTAPGRILFALQAIAMILLAVSLTVPELRRPRVEFHNPAILILRDRSASFQDGAYLGLGGAYRDFEKKLIETYESRKFDVRVADFAETAWPVRGFAREGSSGTPHAQGPDDASLTSLAALADFVDSAAVPNLQAAFLFSDGRADLDSGRASRTWRVPLYPVAFAADSIAEIQPERAQLALNPEGAAARADLEVAWRRVGKPIDVNLRVLQGGKTLLTRKLPASAQEDGVVRTPWSPEKSALDGREPMRAILQPADAGADFDAYNDTLSVAFPQGRAERVIHVFRPVRSLDEKGMLGILQAWEGTQVSFFGTEEMGRLNPGAGDQVWVEAGAVSGRMQAWLQGLAAKVVIYARNEPGRNPQVTGLGKAAWRSFPSASEIKAGKAAAEAFPDEIVRLKSLAEAPVEAPETADGILVEAREGGKRGMLMGRIRMGEGKRAFFFCLPAIWAPLFDPQGDFATRENIAAYVKAAWKLAAVEDGTARISRPGRAYHRVPFDVEISVPEKREGARAAAGPLSFVAVSTAVAGGSDAASRGFTQSWPVPESAGGAGAAEFRIKGVTLPRGSYRLELRAGSETILRDSLSVAPKAALELARIGFDRAALEDAASRSGGRVLEPSTSSGTSSAGAPPTADAKPAKVTSVLPDLPGAQIRMEKTSSIRLYNTLVQCVLIMVLLSLSWLLRKKWDFD